MTLSAALPPFLIALREGFEAALVVGIVLAALNRAGQIRLQIWAYAGVGAGILASLVFGIGLNSGLQALQSAYPELAPILKPALSAGIGLIAIVLLSWMLLWMTQQSKQLKAEVEAAVTEQLQNTAAAWGVFGIVTTAVLREGLETVLFLTAQAQDQAISIGGAIAGLLTAGLMGALLFQWGVRINVRQFFQTMGILLLLIVGGLLISVLKNANAAVFAYVATHPHSPLCGYAPVGDSACLLGPQVWDFSQFLPDQQFPGVLLKLLMGYRDHLYTLQLFSYGIFWLTIGRTYLQSISNSTTPAHSSGLTPKARN